MNRRQSTDPNASLPNLQRNEQYYLEDGNIHFLVGNELFKVHRFFLERDSRYFRERVLGSASPGGHLRGTSDSNAIMLEVNPAIFEHLLWVFYNPRLSIYIASISDWTSILELAVNWEFVEVKNLAVRALEELPIPDIDRIALYQRYDVDKTHLVKYYVKLCTRMEPIEPEEGKKLGLQTALILAGTREKARAGSGNASPVVGRDDGVKKLLYKAFAISGPTSSGGASTGAATCTSGGNTSTAVNVGHVVSITNGAASTSGTSGSIGAATGTNGPTSNGQADKRKKGSKNQGGSGGANPEPPAGPSSATSEPN